MAYAKGSVIGQNDVHFYTIRVNNNVLGSGSGNYGYGQSLLPTNTPGFPKITSETLLRTERAIENLLKHQGGPIDTTMYPYATGQVIQYDPRLPENYQRILDGRLNSAIMTGYLANFANGFTSGFSTTSQSAFNSTQTVTVTATFASHDNARYFFNAGGFFSLTFSHPTAPLAAQAAGLGRLIFGSGTRTAGGRAWNAVERLDINNLGAVATIFPTSGFYNIGSGGAVASNLIAYTGGSGGSGIEVYASYNGSGSITFTMLSHAWSGVQPANPPRIAAGSTFTVLGFPPNTTYLTDSWGTPIMSSTSDSAITEATELQVMSHWYTNRSNYVRSGLSPASYPNIPNAIYGEYYQWNNPHFRYYNGYYTEIFGYNTADVTPRGLSEYFTVVTCVTGALGSYRDNTPTDTPIGDGGQGANATLVSTKYKIYTGDFVGRGLQPNNQYNDGVAYRISVYRGYLAENSRMYVVAPQSGQNAGSWTYQFVIPGLWSDAKEEVDFDVNTNRTLGPGRMAVILSERGGNFGSLQQAATPYAINYDTWWYNGGDFQINPNPTSSPINVDLRYWNSGYTPRVYLELSKDGGAATPTTTAPAPPTFDPGSNPGYYEAA